jgi:hypothetical protein
VGHSIALITPCLNVSHAAARLELKALYQGTTSVVAFAGTKDVRVCVGHSIALITPCLNASHAAARLELKALYQGTTSVVAFAGTKDVRVCVGHSIALITPCLNDSHAAARLELKALYQGTTSVVPFAGTKDEGFSPCYQPSQGLKPDLQLVFCGTTVSCPHTEPNHKGQRNLLAGAEPLRNISRRASYR